MKIKREFVMNMKKIVMMLAFSLVGQSLVAANITVKNSSGTDVVFSFNIYLKQSVPPVKIPNGGSYSFSTGVHTLIAINWVFPDLKISNRNHVGFSTPSVSLNRLKLNAKFEILSLGEYRDNFEGVTNNIMSDIKVGAMIPEQDVVRLLNLLRQ